MGNIYRTCRHKNKNYLFHCFEQHSYIISSSLMNGGHPGGQVGGVFAIIEDGKGHLHRVDPTEITFTDDKYEEIFKNCEVAEHESK